MKLHLGQFRNRKHAPIITCEELSWKYVQAVGSHKFLQWKNNSQSGGSVKRLIWGATDVSDVHYGGKWEFSSSSSESPFLVIRGSFISRVLFQMVDWPATAMRCYARKWFRISSWDDTQNGDAVMVIAQICSKISVLFSSSSPARRSAYRALTDIRIWVDLEINSLLTVSTWETHKMNWALLEFDHLMIGSSIM